MKIYYNKHRTSDGSVEVLEPHEYADGSYRVEIRVSRAEMEDFAQKGAKVRMSGPRTTQPSVVTPTIKR